VPCNLALTMLLRLLLQGVALPPLQLLLLPTPALTLA
jgi:hypothetical protein